MKYDLDWKQIGQRLKERRKLLGYTQAYVGDIIFSEKDDSGKCPDHARTVSNHESGQPFKFETLLKYCDIYDCDLGYLLGDYDESTHDLHFICSETGLSEEAVNRLRDEYFLPYMSEEKEPTKKKIDPLILAEYRELASKLILQIYDHECLSSKIHLFLSKKRKCDEYTNSPYYEYIMKAYKELWGGELSYRIAFDSITDVETLISKDVEDIQNYLTKAGYTQSQIDDIDDETDCFFTDKTKFETLKEYEIASIQNELVRFLDDFKLKAIRKCDCGRSPILQPYDLKTGNTYYYYKCPDCGHTTSGGSTGINAMGTMITDARAKEIALIKWNRNITRELEKKRHQENKKREIEGIR